MKKLSKLRLINWHLFTNTTTNIENLTFLTGANGTGKSTIIDALQIVLLGDTTGRNFNKAANEKGTGRTLMGYLRCETGKTANGDTICIRKGRFSSYVAIEFYDDVKEKHFTVGIVFDVFETDTKDQSFFFINDKFPENNFTNSELTDSKQTTRPLTIKELSDYCKASYAKEDYKFFDTSTAYQQFIKEQFGSLPDKYFTLFKKAVSFTPISNISQFITEFVCDVDYKIDITPMQKNIEQYKLLELEAKKIEEKIGELKDIQTCYNDFYTLNNSIASFAYISTRVEFDRLEGEVRKVEDRVREYQQRVNEIDFTVDSNKTSISDLQNDRESYLAKKLSSAGFSLSEKLNTKKNQLTNQINIYTKEAESVYASLTDYAIRYSRNIRTFIDKYSSFKGDIFSPSLFDKFSTLINESKEFVSTCETIISLASRKDVNNDLIISFQSDMEAYKQRVNSVLAAIQNEAGQKNDQLYELQNSIGRMNSGIKPFPPAYLEVKEEFEQALKARYHDAKVLIYCDLVDVVDREWTRALECALLAQKLHLFVNDKYYTEASKLLGEICDRKQFYSIAVVDSEKIIASSIVPGEDSVAHLIKTQHAGARAYTDFLLGRIKKCSTFEEAREAGTGLLSNCTGYRNFTSWYLDKRKGERSFLGTKIDSQTQFSVKEDCNTLEKDISIFSDIQTMLFNIVSCSTLSNFEANRMAESLDNFKQVDELKVSLTRYESQIGDTALNSVNELTNKIDEIDQDIRALELANETLIAEKGAKTNDIFNLTNNELPKLRMYLEQKRKDLDNYDPHQVEEVYEKEYQKALEQYGFKNLIEEISKRHRSVMNRIASSKSKLIQLRANYCSKYHLNYDFSKENTNEEFDKELTSLEDVLLPSYREKINEAHTKAIKEFRDDFIYKLRNSITTVKSQIDDLNLALKDCKFGRDSYTFSVTPDRNFADYYNMIMDELLLSVGDAEDEYLEKYNDKMEELFNMISDSGTTKQDEKEVLLNNIARFTDYRTYLVFDLLVTKGDDGRTTSLAHTFKTTSGGESQTPFYISILASFAQLYRVNNLSNNNTIRLVIFDEAFSKMDAVRIKEACALLRQFGLQAILSTPSEKLRDLIHSVDLILVAIHDEKKGHRSYIDVYKDTTKKEEKLDSVFVNKEEKKEEKVTEEETTSETESQE